MDKDLDIFIVSAELCWEYQDTQNSQSQLPISLARSIHRGNSAPAPWLGWLWFGEFPWLFGRCCSYILPQQGGGISQILGHPTKVQERNCHGVVKTLCKQNVPPLSDPLPNLQRADRLDRLGLPDHLPARLRRLQHHLLALLDRHVVSRNVLFNTYMGQ